MTSDLLPIPTIALNSRALHATDTLLVRDLRRNHFDDQFPPNPAQECGINLERNPHEGKARDLKAEFRQDLIHLELI